MRHIRPLIKELIQGIVWANMDITDLICRNLNLKLVTKTMAGKSVGQKGGPGNTFYTLRSAGECERMNPHTPKATPIWRVRVSMDSQIFKEQLQGSKPIGLKNFLYHWKSIKT